MGALLTSLLRKSSLFLENIVRFLAQLRAIKFVRSKISWPPSAAGVRRNAPYLFLGVYLPKLIFDIWTITRRVPIDEELLRESEAELTACVAKSGQVLNAFLAADIPVPKSSPLFDSKLKIFNCIRLLLQKYGMHKPHKASLRLKNKCVVKNKSVTKSPIAGSQQLNAGQQQPSLPQDNENIILPLLNDVHESNLPETDAYAEDLEDIKSQDSCDDGKNDIDLFRLDEALIKAISEGNFTDEFDEMHERLTAIASNVDVIKGESFFVTILTNVCSRMCLKFEHSLYIINFMFGRQTSDTPSYTPSPWTSGTTRNHDNIDTSLGDSLKAMFSYC